MLLTLTLVSHWHPYYQVLIPPSLLLTSLREALVPLHDSVMEGFFLRWLGRGFYQTMPLQLHLGTALVEFIPCVLQRLCIIRNPEVHFVTYVKLHFTAIRLVTQNLRKNWKGWTQTLQ